MKGIHPALPSLKQNGCPSTSDMGSMLEQPFGAHLAIPSGKPTHPVLGKPTDTSELRRPATAVLPLGSAIVPDGLFAQARRLVYLGNSVSLDNSGAIRRIDILIAAGLIIRDGIAAILAGDRIVTDGHPARAAGFLVAVIFLYGTRSEAHGRFLSRNRSSRFAGSDRRHIQPLRFLHDFTNAVRFRPIFSFTRTFFDSHS